MAASVFVKEYPTVKIARNCKIVDAHILPVREAIELSAAATEGTPHFLFIGVENGEEQDTVIGRKENSFERVFTDPVKRIDSLLTESGVVINVVYEDDRVTLLPVCPEHNELTVVCLASILKPVA